MQGQGYFPPGDGQVIQGFPVVTGAWSTGLGRKLLPKGAEQKGAGQALPWGRGMAPKWAWLQAPTRQTLIA